MKHLLIRLSPKNEIGRLRIAQFVERKKTEGLPLDGKAKMFPDGSALINFTMPLNLEGGLADFVKNQAVSQITKIAKSDIIVETETQ